MCKGDKTNGGSRKTDGGLMTHTTPSIEVGRNTDLFFFVLHYLYLQHGAFNVVSHFPQNAIQRITVTDFPGCPVNPDHLVLRLCRVPPIKRDTKFKLVFIILIFRFIFFFHFSFVNYYSLYIRLTKNN